MSNIKRTPTEDPVIDRIEDLLKLNKKNEKGFVGISWIRKFDVDEMAL